MSTIETSYWSVACTCPQREAFAAERLADAGFEILLPRILAGRSKRLAPMFVGYVFVDLNGARSHWHAVDRTVGIIKLVRFGDQPAHLPDREVAALRARMDADGVIRLPPPPARRAFAKGARVRIVGGAFDGLAGVHSGMTAGERESVLIHILGRATKVAIADRLVAPR